ncbi:hypothetical protein [Helicobacter cinaedi]|nr:hypothetical protein [Helicobacter cinaedi]
MINPKKNELMDTCKVAITQALGATKALLLEAVLSEVLRKTSRQFYKKE